jgi:hypothetical protein
MIRRNAQNSIIEINPRYIETKGVIMKEYITTTQTIQYTNGSIPKTNLSLPPGNDWELHSFQASDVMKVEKNMSHPSSYHYIHIIWMREVQ